MHVHIDSWGCRWYYSYSDVKCHPIEDDKDDDEDEDDDDDEDEDDDEDWPGRIREIEGLCEHSIYR